MIQHKEGTKKRQGRPRKKENIIFVGREGEN